MCPHTVCPHTVPACVCSLQEGYQYSQCTKNSAAYSPPQREGVTPPVFSRLCVFAILHFLLPSQTILFRLRMDDISHFNVGSIDPITNFSKTSRYICDTFEN